MKTKQVQEVRERMILIYGDVCWMAYKVTPRNEYTYHHIFEARKGGKVTIGNGAIITRYAHDDLNEMEHHIRECYKDLNILFTELNDTRKPPKKEYYQELKKILSLASKKIDLNRLYDPNMDPVMLEELAYMTSEERQINLTKEDEEIITVDYAKILAAAKEESKIIIERPVELEEHFKHKIKHKTRHKEYYDFRNRT